MFKLSHKESDSKARTGEIKTDHGSVETPIFMPVGTQGTVKAVAQDRLTDEIHTRK